MASFGEGFASGMQLGNFIKQKRFEQSIDDAGKSVAQEMQKEKDFALSQRQLVDNAKANDTITPQPVNPSIYQQGDSLGLEGYQTGNKPIQTTMPIAPPGYGTREDGTTPDTTLLGNYNTAAALKGERPTAEDTRMMQRDTQRPYNGPQDNNILDLAQIKPEVAPQEAAKPKMLDILNDQVTTSTRAKDIYDYNTRVIQKLQQGGNARAALEFQSKVSTSELTLAQADHMKFNTISALGKKVGDMASNALEAMQVPGADVNKIFYDTMESAKVDLGYTGKVPFSMDPRENIKTLQLLQKNSLTASEKAELGIKQAVATQKSVMDNAELAIKQDKLTLDKINTGLAMTKENREQGTAAFNRLSENVKLQFQALNSINSVMDEDYKKALRPIYDANLKTLQDYSKALNVPMPNIASGNPSNVYSTGKAQPGIAPNPAMANPSPNTQQVNNAFPADVLQDAGVSSEAGGYVPPTTTAKTPAQEKAKAARIKLLQSKINELEPKTNTRYSSTAISNPISDVINLGEKAVSSVANSDLLNPSKAGQKQRDRKAKELKKLQDELDALKNS
jgi:hypothetical protein